MRRDVEYEEDDNFDYLFKLVLIGDAGVGKSALVHRFKYNTYVDRQASTIGVDFIIRSVTVDGKKIKLQIWDTAGQERFRTITQGYYRAAHAVIVVYDISSQDTFKRIPSWLNDVDRFANDCKIKLLIGNKCDQSEHRAVSYEEGENFAGYHGVNEFLEASAKDSTNVEEAFLRSAELLKNYFEHDLLYGKEARQTVMLDSRRVDRWGCCS